MLGILLLAVSVILYFSPRKRYLSYFLYISFMFDGYKVLIDPVLGGVKNGDIALVYTFVISLVMILQKKYVLVHDKITKWFVVFVLFLGCSMIFSMYHYDIPFMQVIQGGRFLLLVFCYPILRNMKLEECKRLFNLLARFTVLVGIVDVVQVIIQIPIIPTYEINRDPATGLIRFFNYPVFSIFFLIVCLVKPDYFGKRTKYVLGLLLVCIMGTLGRSLMLITLICILLGLWFQGKRSAIIKYGLIITICALPFSTMISERYVSSNSGTQDDINAVLHGNIELNSYEQIEGSFTYRLSWVLERFQYLEKRPVGEKIFGLGLLSDSSPLSQQMYRFIVNIKFYGSGMVQQLRSPDIAYGTMLAYLGFGGFFVYVMFVYNLFKGIFKMRTYNCYFLAGSIWIIFTFLISFFSDDLTNPYIFSLCYILLSIKDRLKNETSLYNKLL